MRIRKRIFTCAHILVSAMPSEMYKVDTVCCKMSNTFSPIVFILKDKWTHLKMKRDEQKDFFQKLQKSKINDRPTFVSKMNAML